MEVQGSVGQLGQGCTAAASCPLSARAMAPPPLLESKPERSEGKNQLKGSPCLS